MPREAHPGAVDSSDPGWQDILQQIKHGQYGHAQLLIKSMQERINRSEAFDLYFIFTTLQLLCLVCSQLQSQSEILHKNYLDTTEREQWFRQELSKLIMLLIEHHQSHHYAQAKSDCNASNNLTIFSQSSSHLSLIKQCLQKLLGNNSISLPLSDPKLEIPALAVPVLALTNAQRMGIDDNKVIAPASVLVFCLGRFQVSMDGQMVSNWAGNKGKSIFKYLITHREQAIRRDILMDLFWREAPPESARRNLNWAIHCMRALLHKYQPTVSHVLFQDECYLINPDLSIWIDVDEFDQHIHKAQSLEETDMLQATQEYQAADLLYHGEFLEEDRYDDWVQPKRQMLRMAYLSMLDRLSEYFYLHQQYDACIHHCMKMLTCDPCREEAHARLMQCYYQQGYPYLAIRQYQLCVEKLKTELDVLPSQTTIRLFDTIRQVISESLAVGTNLLPD